MTSTEKIANLLAKTAILRDELAINSRVAASEIDSLTTSLGEAVETIYNNDLEVIENV